MPHPAGSPASSDFSSHITEGSFLQDNMISCHASPGENKMKNRVRIEILCVFGHCQYLKNRDYKLLQLFKSEF